ncbi:MAG: Nitrilase/cyanide hydratase and apolipoprotein N-acyltransferase [Deltaproteobacteria bacterium]|nr:Nitrilase/cyanide hydratase and apolipoprotein N-acyltransferase [Deltaproteobacteria bacterium]
MIKLAGIQITCSEEKERNIAKAVRFIKIAIEKGAHIICLQELFTTHWFPREMNKRFFSLAEKADGLTIGTMRRLAKEYGVVLICPIFETEENSFYNSAFVVDADGEVLGSYRKIHVPQIPLWEEKYYFSSGNHGFPVFKTKFAPIGIQICWDNFFPEGSRILALKGAKILFSPTAAAFAPQRRWETVISSNAIANGVYIFRVNRVGSEEKQDFYGRSFCISPEGELLDKPTGLKDSIALIEVDLKNIDKTRKEWPFLRDRRPELYREIAESMEQNGSRVRLE